MSTQNALALLNWYRSKNVHAVRTPAGIQLMGIRNLTEKERRTLLSFSQEELDAAIRWQK